MKPPRARGWGEAWQGVVCLAFAPGGRCAATSRWWEAAWAAYTLALAAAQVAHGEHRPEASVLIQHNLHSVRVGANLCRPYRWAGSPTRS